MNGMESVKPLSMSDMAPVTGSIGSSMTPKKKKKKKRIAVEEIALEPKKKKKKKRVVEEEVEAPVKRKKKKSKALAVVDDNAPVVIDAEGLSKEDKRKAKELTKRMEKLRSTFKKGVPKIHELIYEGNNSAAASLIQRNLLLMLTEAIPELEHRVRRSQGDRGVYSLNALVSQSRELIADIKSEDDTSEVAGRICNEVLQHAFTMIGQNLATSLYHVREGLMPYMKEGSKDRVNTVIGEAAKELSKYAGETYKDVYEKIMRMLVLEE